MPLRKPFYLVLDVGTTSVKTLLFDEDCQVLERASRDLSKHFPKRGWVEQDPLEILRTSQWTMRAALEQSGCRPSDCLGMGITNQRETTTLWDAASGKALYPSIVWEDRRTERWCQTFTRESHDLVHALTGLSLEAYFSASKIRWILDHVPQASSLLAKNAVRFGTIDTWLLWHLTAGHLHLTDETNAARTLLFALKKQRWDEQLLNLFHIPSEILPEVRSAHAGFGLLDRSILGQEIPILAVCGDQQSSFYAAAQITTETPITKITCGTGTFITQSIPKLQSRSPFYTTIAPYPNQKTGYVLEGKIPRGGKQIEPLLKDAQKLNQFLQKLASDIHVLLQQLPIQPKALVLDGGVSRDGLLGSWIEKLCHVQVKTLPIFDGTALGTAFLCRDARTRTVVSPSH